MSWAATSLPTAVNTDGQVVYSNAGGDSFDNYEFNALTSETLTLPAGTIESGTILKIKTVSFGKKTSGGKNPPDHLNLAGVDSAAAVVTEGGFAAAESDKYTYSFENTVCLMKVGTASPIKFLNASGANVAVGFRLVKPSDNYTLDSYFLSSAKSTGNWAVIVEIEAEIVTGKINESAHP